jgi:hypothetical protein
MSALILALMLALVLAVPLSEAACVWVLWDHETVTARGVSEQKWIIRGTWTDEARCLTSLDMRVRQATEQGALVTGSEPRELVHSGAHGSSLARTLYCLPDTIDPRGPKGGRR